MNPGIALILVTVIVLVQIVLIWKAVTFVAGTPPTRSNISAALFTVLILVLCTVFRTVIVSV